MNRNKLEVIAKILDYVARRERVIKTHILYYANLNTTSLEKILSWMTTRKLLVSFKERKRIYYSITPQGLLFLDKLREISRVMSEGSEQSLDEYSSLENALKSETGIRNCRIINTSITGKSGIEHLHQVIETPLSKYLFLFIDDERNLSPSSIRSLGYSIIVAKDAGLPLLIAFRNKRMIDQVNSLVTTCDQFIEVKIVLLRNVYFI